MGTPLIQTVHLSKFFKVSKDEMLHAVDDVSLSIEKGETLGVVGESGCGKSTLGRSILRLCEPTGGEVLFEGKNILEFQGEDLKETRRRMQIIFQDPYASLNPRMNIETLIAEPLVVNRVYKTRAEIHARVLELMNIVGLARRLCSAYPHELDGGRRQRIGVARALALNPSFIVCDEPVSALDVSIQAQILNLLMDLQEEFGLTYLFITHDMSVVKHISTNIAVMYLGQCVELVKKEELFERQYHPYTKALLSAIPEPTLEMRNKKPQIVRGELSSPVNPKPGCRFAPRCPMAAEACTKECVSLKEITPGHFSSCIFARQLQSD